MLQCEPLNVNPGAFCVLIAGCRCPSRTVIRPAACAAGFAQRADRRWEVNRLPLQILAEGNIAGRIILLEPRRLAARNVAQRLAELLGEKPGRPWVSACAPKPASDRRPAWRWLRRILTRMIQRDPELTGVGLVILDEFHERSLQADLALALLLDVQQGLRDDLKLLIMSATLDNDRLQRLLPEAPVVVSEGRIYPVERRFSPLSAHQRFDEAVAVAAAELLRHEQDRCCCFCPASARFSAFRNS
nr:ATP-dependent RNA helicase HrpB [Klebsiella pneumoniae]